MPCSAPPSSARCAMPSTPTPTSGRPPSWRKRGMRPAARWRICAAPAAMDAPSRVLTADLAAGWAEAALASLERPYPHLLSHLLNGPGDAAAAPQALHPAFWGSFDWHSSVHMHWTL